MGMLDNGIILVPVTRQLGHERDELTEVTSGAEAKLPDDRLEGTADSREDDVCAQGLSGCPLQELPRHEEGHIG